jgi:hypothetical protein
MIALDEDAISEAIVVSSLGNPRTEDPAARSWISPNLLYLSIVRVKWLFGRLNLSNVRHYQSFEAKKRS